MKPIPWRTQLWLVWAGYGVSLLISAGLIVMRYLQYVFHRADADAYGGMWAGGDMILAVFICGLFLVPTFFLVLVIAKSEAAYTLYSKVLVGFSVTAPLSLGLLAIPRVGNGWMPGGFFLFRLVATPVVLAGMAFSRVMAKFPKAKKLTLYALLIELGTAVLMVAMFLWPSTHRG